MTEVNAELIKKGQAYEYYVLTDQASPRAGAVALYCAKLLKDSNPEISQEIERLSSLSPLPWPKRAIKLIPYEVIGQALADEMEMGTNERWSRFYKLRREAIEAGQFEERKVVNQDYESRKRELVEQLATEAITAAEENGIENAEISIENIAPDNRADFVNQNGSYQMIIMSPGENDGKGGETIGVVIRNAQGQIIKNLLGRELTLTTGKKE